MLARHRNELDQLFNALKAIIKEKLPDFGKHAAGDGKYYDSYTPNKHSAEAKDHRGEQDAAYSQKTYRFLGDDGKMHEKKETHYGFRTQTLVDTETGLPIACVLAKENIGEREEMLKLLNQLPSEERQWTEFINERFNDPAIIVWVPLNESWGMRDIFDNALQQQRAKAIVNLTKALFSI